MASQLKSMKDLWKDSYLASGNEDYIENLYETYLNDPSALSPEWRKYFDQLATQSVPNSAISHAAIREEFLQLARNTARVGVPQGIGTYQDIQQEHIIELIDAYRRVGHLRATVDPLQLWNRSDTTPLNPTYYGFSDADLQKTFHVSDFSALNKTTATLQEILDGLNRVYTSNIGFEYSHMNHVAEVEWVRERIEKNWANFKPSNELKKNLLKSLVEADGIEKYLGFKYVGQKRFSLEGGDGLIPMLDTIIKRSAESGVKETVIGMAHRGRLNVLVNIVGKEPKAIFAAFEGSGISQMHSGDVKYHLGYSSNVQTPSGPMHMVLAFNPSHLEIVSPVVQGSVRARQRRRKDVSKEKVLPIQIHGDSAFAGQGVVMETFSMSQARWFCVGGSIHIVINNQVGFTTSNIADTRSTTYCTDVAKMVEAPILHVNGNDPEAVYFAALFAIDYRNTFKKDVVLDLVCYRRHGHNEADEPSATQPVMYQTIKAMQPPYAIYAEKLIAEGVIKAGDEKVLVDAYRDGLDAGKAVVDVLPDHSVYEYGINWEKFLNKTWQEKTPTHESLDHLISLAEKLEHLPDDFVVQPQVKKTLELQKKMTEGKAPINWGYAESLAYATLLEKGYPIRLCGQDAGRGTFAHRHAILHDQRNDNIYIPLSHVSPNQAQINIVDSLLSEEAVLAFEYGYATTEPNNLVIWEAQFGDFANGAQVVFDQFISSGEQKWGRLCGLVMLLPHGYEGQGPEHSSARLERYLQLCAQNNMQVCVPSTPAQIYHLLRRQMLRPYRSPLIVMTPKSLLRNPLAVSSLQDLANGEYQLIIPEVEKVDAKKVERVIFCSGKVYYELAEYRRQNNISQVAIVRVEQLYPYAEEAFKQTFATYREAKKIIWCQEEPQNQGAWTFLQNYMQSFLNNQQQLQYVGRAASASPAVGYHSVHEKQQKELVAQAFVK